MTNTSGKTHLLEKIIHFNLGLAAATSMDDLLPQIVQAATELTASESAGIFLAQGVPQQLCLVAASGFNGSLPDVPVENSIADAAFTSGQPVRIQDARNDPCYNPRIEETINIQAHSLLVVPLQYRDCKIGALEIVNKTNRLPFDDDDIEILILLASHATIAIENLRRTQAEIENFGQKLQLEGAKRERLSSDLEAFSSIVAHNIKGLLGTILGYSELICRTAEQVGAPELADWGKESLYTALEVNKILDDLLLLTRVLQRDVTTSPLDMESIVLEAEKRLKKQIEAQQAEIKTPDSWPEAVGHAPWIEEVWVKYLSNALKYGGNPAQIELGAEPLINPRSGLAEVRFWIRDNGLGLSPEKQSLLFAGLERPKEMRTAKRTLGLSIVKRIVEKLDGRVGVESSPGNGSIFFFILPCRSADKTRED